MYEPRSGRDGFFIINSTEYPISSWMYGASVIRPEYRTSISGGYPVRNGGVLQQNVIIVGESNTLVAPNITTDIQEFFVGWNDIEADERDAFQIFGVLDRFTVKLNYQGNGAPGLQWIASFNVVASVDVKELQGPIVDGTLCRDNACVGTIVNNDPVLAGEPIAHISFATIDYLYPRLNYRTSYSDGFTVATPGVADIIVEYVVDGNFPYWVGLGEKFDYKHYFGTGPSDFYLAPKMSLLEISNLTADVRTGRLSQANIKLGTAAYV